MDIGNYWVVELWQRQEVWRICITERRVGYYFFIYVVVGFALVYFCQTVWFKKKTMQLEESWCFVFFWFFFPVKLFMEEDVKELRHWDKNYLKECSFQFFSILFFFVPVCLFECWFFFHSLLFFFILSFVNLFPLFCFCIFLYIFLSFGYFIAGSFFVSLSYFFFFSSSLACFFPSFPFYLFLWSSMLLLVFTLKFVFFSRC